MQIKLSRLKQIISEVVEEKYAGERMDDIMQSSREEEVVEEIDPHDQAIDDMIAEEIEAAMEAFVLGEADESECAELERKLSNASQAASMNQNDTGAFVDAENARKAYDKAGCAEAQGGEGGDKEAAGGGEIKPDVQKVMDKLRAIDNATEFAQLINVVLDLLSKPEIKKALGGILTKAGLDSKEKTAFATAVMNHNE